MTDLPRGLDDEGKAAIYKDLNPRRRKAKKHHLHTGDSLTLPGPPRYHLPSSPAQQKTATPTALSDFSDYSSDDGDASSDSSSIPAGAGSTPARSYAQYVREEDQRTGKGKGLLAEPEEEDPFADPFADSSAAADGMGDY
ncbi:hypothetical protein JCM11641_001501 [Rhodosporidiobolus odoratus]